MTRLSDLSLPPDTCFRATRRRYADLAGEGARLVGGRWNSPGRAAVYLAEAAALAVLETLVHLDLNPGTIPDDYVIMEVDCTALSNTPNWLEAGPDFPPADEACKAMGDDFLSSGRALAARVPSVIVPFCRNLILNPAHHLAAAVKIRAVHSFAFDRRLLERKPAN